MIKNKFNTFTFQEKISEYINKTRNEKSFLHNVLTITSGTVIAQAVTIAASPILTRYYTPSEMGIIASLLGIVMIIGVVASGRYELAVVLPEKESEAIAVVILGVIIAGISGLILTGVLALFGHKIAPYIGLTNVPDCWLNIIGLMVFLIGIENVMNRFAIRNRHFKVLAATQVTQQIGANGIKIFLGILKSGVSGLFIGTLFGYVLRAIRLLWSEKAALFNKKKFPSYKDLVSVSKRYKKFPLISSWAGLLNTASTQIPVVLFATLFSPAAAGYYALSHRVLSLPMSLIGRSVGDVFFERAARVRENPEELGRITLEISKKLLILGSFSMSIITFYGDILFSFVFGEQWVEAGRYAQWISIWLVLVFVSSPLSTVYLILEKQLEHLFFNIVMFLSRIGVIAFGAYYAFSDYEVIILFSILGAVLWLVMCIRVLQIANVNAIKILTSIFLIIVPIYLLQYFLSVAVRSFF
ncbi:MAG TPA: oligosaccharide flippase family protein [bacterium]|nr:oligosaccharide flippase family protein [bacterium]HPS28786.1 oligosaccharide flippase family protein [bacterium]